MSDNRDPGPDEARLWEEGWAGHESAQRMRLADWSVERKLRWLTECNALARSILGTEGFRRARRRALGLDDA